MNQYFSKDTVDIIIQTVSMAVIFVIVFFIYRFVYSRVWKKVSVNTNTVDDYILKLLKAPILLMLYWFLFNIFIYIFYTKFQFFPVLLKIRNLLLIFTLAWLSIRFITAGAYYLQTRYDLGLINNLQARKSLTQVKVFKGIAITIIIIIAIGAALMTFEQARKAGVSVLTSAGIIGIIVGLAAQKSIGMILAGIQLAITQPIRLDDLVIIEGEFGRIEEIELFLERPFQNLTRSTSSTTGTIFLFVDYGFPVDSLREALPEMLRDNKNWDGRTAKVQVTNTTEKYKEIRILLSSEDSSKNWDLRTHVREKLIDFINANFPDSFAGIRIKTVQ